MTGYTVSAGALALLAGAAQAAVQHTDSADFALSFVFGGMDIDLDGGGADDFSIFPVLGMGPYGILNSAVRIASAPSYYNSILATTSNNYAVRLALGDEIGPAANFGDNVALQTANIYSTTYATTVATAPAGPFIDGVTGYIGVNFS